MGTFRELKEVIDEATDPDPANRAKIEICPDEPIVFDSIVDISDKYFEIECHESSECVLDLNGYSFVTPKPSFGTGSKFYAGFESIIIENGSTVSLVLLQNCVFFDIAASTRIRIKIFYNALNPFLHAHRTRAGMAVIMEEVEAHSPFMAPTLFLR